MKTLTKKAIVLASAIAVAGTFAVCAASYTSLSAADTTTATKSVSVDFANDLVSTDQITILAYYDPAGTATPDATNIVYIDQVEKGALTNITFSLRDGDATGNYKVLMGGSGVTTAGADTFTYAAAQTGSTVSGSVDSLVYFGDPAGDEFMIQLNADYQTTATLWNENWAWAMDDTTNKVASVVVDSTTGLTNNTFSFANVPVGNYYLTLNRAGKCTKVVYISVVQGQDVAVGTKALIGADTNGDFEVTSSDLGVVVRAFENPGNTEYGTDQFNVLADENGSGDMSSADVGAVVRAFESFDGSYIEVPQ